MIYLTRKNDKVVAHANAQAMMELDGVTPEIEVADEAYYAADGLARIIDDEIFLGKNPEELAEETRQGKIAGYKAQLEQIDRDAKAGRAVRKAAMDFAGVVRVLHGQNPALAEFDPDTNVDLQRLSDYEQQAIAIRQQLAPLLGAGEAAEEPE